MIINIILIPKIKTYILDSYLVIPSYFGVWLWLYAAGFLLFENKTVLGVPERKGA